MPRLAQSVPKYRQHRASGQAFVELSGRRYYLGLHGSKASRIEYDRLIGQWLQNGRTVRPDEGKPGNLLLVELIVAYLSFADRYYRKGGRRTSEYTAIVHALRPVKQLYGRKHVVEFGPIALRTVMSHMVAMGWARVTVNRQAGRIKRLIRWGVSRELVPANVYHALQSVEGLRQGRSTAKETAPVLPVADEVVEATLEHLPEVIADMIRVQSYTGCRPCEICLLRPVDIDRSAETWIYKPSDHKTQHHGRARIIFIGPRAQAVLRKYLARDPEMHCFRPIDSEAKRRAGAHAARTTPLSCGDVPGSNRQPKPKRSPGKRYDVNAYRRAIHRGCDRAFSHPTLSGLPKAKLTAEQLAELKKWQSARRWSPNQLRHTAATRIRREFGLEASQIVLGHASAVVTQIYAERDWQKGVEIARRIG
jgi:integrase